MPTGLTYTTYLDTIYKLAAIDATTDGDFATVVPAMIQYAENRIYRELDLLSNVVRSSTAVLTQNNRTLNLPDNVYIVHGMNVLTPVGQTDADASTCTRNPLIPISRDFLDMAWPGATNAAVPKWFAVIRQFGNADPPSSYAIKVIVAPAPNAAYNVEVIFSTFPDYLSASNSSDFISIYLSDLLVAASMIFVAGYKQNFSATGDDPASGVSWEKQYQTLLASAGVQELRRKFQGASWSSQTPSPLASPPRG